MPRLAPPPKPELDPAAEADLAALEAALQLVETVQALRVRPVRSCELIEYATAGHRAALSLFDELTPKGLGRKLGQYVDRAHKDRMLVRMLRSGHYYWAVVLVRESARTNVWDLRARSIQRELSAETVDGLFTALGAVLAEFERRGIDAGVRGTDLTEER